MKKRGNINAKGFKKSLRGGGNREEARVACLFDDLAAKFVKDVRTIRRKDDKSETEKVVLVDSSNEHELDLPNNKLKGIHMNNLTEIDHASMPLGIFASKSASDVGIAMPTYFKDLAAWLPSRLAAKKSAFTLAEVLITLGIIGVVAAITLPSLIQRNVEKQRVAQLKKAYSELSQAYNLAVEEFGAPTEWGMGGMYEEKSHYIMANNMRKFLKLSVDCVDMTEAQTEKNCGFKGAYGGAQGIYNERNYKYVVLNDGALVQFQIYSGACNWPFGAINNVCGEISVDLNGATPPSRNGEDIFNIFITRNKLVPAGIDGASLSFERACNRAIKKPYGWYSGDNMYSCTAWVLYNENMDYLHCDDLSWSGKHSCKE